MRYGVPFALIVVLVVAFATIPAAVAEPPDATHSSEITGDGVVAATNHTPPPDPEEDVLGWEGGYWYNESIDVNQSDGLDREELDRVIARTMARVERIRQLEFERTPPVNFVTREEYATAIDRAFANVSVTAEDRLHQNTKFEALFLVGEETEYYDVFRENQQGFAAAFYTASGFPAANVSAGEIAIVRDSTGEIRLTETTLAHELVHALQDQVFDYSTTLPSGDTEDEARAIDGVIEGDASYVQSLYTDRCGGAWEGCLTAERSGSSSFANLGVVLYGLVQYGNGLTFIESIRNRGGWAAVNDLYTDPPETSEQIIHPSKYPGETSRNLTIEDRSDDRWRPLDLNGSVDHATFGEAGLFVMFWFPSYIQRGEVILPYNAPFLDREVQPYDFAGDLSDGWDGDRLLPFVADESAETNQTGYVWKLAWDSPEDAEEFLAGYRDLLDFYGAEQVGGATYRLPERDFGSDYADAIHLIREDDLVTIVNAPNVSGLSGVRGGIEVATPKATPTPTETATSTSTSTPTPNPTPTDTEAVTPTPTESTTAPMNDDDPTPTATTSEAGTTDTTPTDEETGTPGQPGMSLLGAALGIGLALYTLRRRAR